jgi:hypothetical protein
VNEEAEKPENMKSGFPTECDEDTMIQIQTVKTLTLINNQPKD